MSISPDLGSWLGLVLAGVSALLILVLLPLALFRMALPRSIGTLLSVGWLAACLGGVGYYEYFQPGADSKVGAFVVSAEKFGSGLFRSEANVEIQEKSARNPYASGEIEAAQKEENAE
jgi:hypothetical protein